MDLVGGEELAKVDNPRLVGNGNESAGNRDEIGCGAFDYY
jgi:hypothetical protein